jgi:MFS family permease
MASSVAERARLGAAAKRGVVAAVALAVFCVDVDFFALNLALPATARDLGVTTTNLQWAIAVYQLTLASFLIPGGRLGDLLGRKRVLLAGIGLFGFSSLLCGASQSAEMLIAARFVQGIGASLLFPVGISVISNAFPVAERGRAIGNVYGVGAIGTAVGPFVGGLLTDLIDWRWVFFFNVPFTLAALLLTRRNVGESRDISAQRIDLRGLVAVTLGVAAFTYAIDRGSAWGWLSASTLGLAAAGIGLLVLFLFIEARVRSPLVDLELFRNIPYHRWSPAWCSSARPWPTRPAACWPGASAPAAACPTGSWARRWRSAPSACSGCRCSPAGPGTSARSRWPGSGWGSPGPTPRRHAGGRARGDGRWCVGCDPGHRRGGERAVGRRRLDPARGPHRPRQLRHRRDRAHDGRAGGAGRAGRGRPGRMRRAHPCWNRPRE